MALRLSELLDRIRPAGAPGAPSDAEPQRELAATAEVAGLVELLRRFEQEADEVIAAATADAVAIRADGDRRAQSVRAELSDRVAVATAATSDTVGRDLAGAVAAITAAGEQEVARLRTAGDLDVVAEQVLDELWRTVGEGRS